MGRGVRTAAALAAVALLATLFLLRFRPRAEPLDAGAAGSAMGRTQASARPTGATAPDAAPRGPAPAPPGEDLPADGRAVAGPGRSGSRDDGGVLGIVEGRVTFGGDGSPVAGIPVRATRDGEEFSFFETGEDGRFTVGIPGRGRCRVAAYPWGDWGFCVGPELDGETADGSFLDLVVPSRASFPVSGRLTESDTGRGVAGARIEGCAVVGPGVAGGRVREVFTDAEGRFATELEVSVQRPVPLKAREDDPEGLTREGDLLVPKQRVQFRVRIPDHPDIGLRATLARPLGETIRVEVVLLREGVVKGVVEAPEGVSPEGLALPVRIVGEDGSVSRWTVRIRGGSFEITIPGDETGRLVIGGRAGSCVVPDLDCGKVNAKTRIEGISVPLKGLRMVAVDLVDPSGASLASHPGKIQYWLTDEGFPQADAVQAESGRILVPSDHVGVVMALRISGLGIRSKVLDLSAGTIPRRIPLEVLTMRISGRIERAGVGVQAFQARIALEVESGGETLLVGQQDISDETGEFRVWDVRIPEDVRDDDVYALTVRVLGRALWMRKGIRLRRFEALEGLVIRIE